MVWTRISGVTTVAWLVLASGCWMSRHGEKDKDRDSDDTATTDDGTNTHGGQGTDTWPDDTDPHGTSTEEPPDTSATVTFTDTETASVTSSQSSSSSDTQTSGTSSVSDSSTSETGSLSESETDSASSGTSFETETTTSETDSLTNDGTNSETSSVSTPTDIEEPTASDSESADTGSESPDTSSLTESDPPDTGEPPNSDSASMDTVSGTDSATAETDTPTAADTDACSLGTHDCAPEARCLPQAEDYECRCGDGYEGDGHICADVNECSAVPGPCTGDATCHNTIGGYECRCELGFTPDGIGGCLAEPGTCAIDPFGYCRHIAVQSATIVERHVLAGTPGTLTAEVYAQAGVSEIASVTADLGAIGGSALVPLTLDETIDDETARFETSVSTSGLDSGLYDIPVTARSTDGATHRAVARLLVYSGAVRPVGVSFSTIQAAIDAAENGDLVLVPAGTYTGPGNTELHTDGKMVIVDSASGPANTIIDLQGTGSGFNLYNTGETARTVIAGLTIRGAGNAAVRLVTTVSGASVTPTLFDLRLEDNTSLDEGGALRVSGSGAGVQLLSSTFSENGWLSRSGEGGALYVGANAYAIVEDSSFSGNQAGYGGAVNADTGSFVELVRCEFTANQSGQKGGAIYADWAVLDLCFFSGNTAAYEGGAIYVYSTASFDDCSFERNASSGLTSAGGAIYGRGSLDVQGSGLRRNDAKHYAGGIYAGGSLSLSDSVFLYNTATDSGGAIMMRAGGTVASSTFHGNAVTTGNTSYGNGGALYVDAPAISPAHVQNCLFSANTSSRSGGAMRATSVTVEGSTFRHNTAGAYGGALYFWSRNNVVRTTLLQANRAALHGGAIYISRDSSPTLLIEDCNFLENVALGSGGSINAYRTLSVTVRRSLFENNEASFLDGLGGGMRCYEVVDGCRIESSIFRGNRANFGGALRTKDARLELWNSLLDHNTSHTSGGGIHINNLVSTSVNVESTTISHNSSLGRGGGLYLYNGALTLKDSIVFDNTAGQGTASAELYVSDAIANATDISYCNIRHDRIADTGAHINGGQGFVPGILGNQSADPLFADPDAFDFGLLDLSPCLDAGSQTAAAAGLDSLSARYDGAADQDVLDLGYHD